MTSAVRPTHDQTLAAAAEQQLVERWRAAQTVRAQVGPDQGRDALLDCLGLLDVTRPENV